MTLIDKSILQVPQQVGPISHFEWQAASQIMAERTILRKDQLEISLHNENKLIKEGAIKDDNPLDLSEPFRDLCQACRKGDLKVCQEKISEGVNVNARDAYDYTPLILVSIDGEDRPHPPGEVNVEMYSCTGQSLRALRGCSIAA